jgi:hypothetical protein
VEDLTMPYYDSKTLHAHSWPMPPAGKAKRAASQGIEAQQATPSRLGHHLDQIRQRQLTL